MVLNNEIGDTSSLKEIRNFSNIEWVDYFSEYQQQAEGMSQSDWKNANDFNKNVDTGEEFIWKNYFDKSLSVPSEFQFLLTESFAWKEYFNSEDTNFPELNAFPSRTDWIQWNDSNSFTWQTLPQLPKFKISIIADEDEHDEPDLLSEISLEFESDSRYEYYEVGTPDLDIYEENTESVAYDTDHLDPSCSVCSNDPNSECENNLDPENTVIVKADKHQQETFLTEKHYEWLTPAYMTMALAKFHRNIHDTRETKSAGWEPPRLDLPEIIEPQSPTEISNHDENDPKTPLIDPRTSTLEETFGLTPMPAPPLLLTVLKPFDPNKMGRPHSSQGLYFQEPRRSMSTDPFLLQVPSNYCTIEPKVPELQPPRRLKTPPSFTADSDAKFWAHRKREPWDNFDNKNNSISKSQKRKLKKIPEISRCRSAIDKPTCFDIDELTTSRTNLIQNSPKGSPKRMLEFRFGRNGCRVTPEPGNFLKSSKLQDLDARKGIHSKVKSTKPKNRRKVKMSFFKRKEWAPVIRNLLKGSIIRPEHSAKIEPDDNSDLSKYNNNHDNNDNNNIAAQAQYNVIKYKDVIQSSARGHGGQQTYVKRPKSADPRRRRPYWVRFLRYCNIRKRFGIRRSGKNHQQGNRVCKIKK